MSDRIFFDSNILVYALDRRHPVKAEIAVQLVRQAIDEGSGFISYQVIHEFFNVAFRKFQPPPTRDEANFILSDIFGALEIVPSTPELISRAFELRDRFRFSWYDCLIVAAAIEGNCDVLYTEDLKDGQRLGDLTVRNPLAGN